MPITAVLTFLFAVNSKAVAIFSDNKPITLCYSTIVVTKGGSQVVITDALTCAESTNRMADKPYVVSVSKPIPSEACLGLARFSCAKLTETADLIAPLIDLGEGLKRYKVEVVFCKD